MQLAPISLFLGSNSSGKSSLLHFWILLRQTMEADNFLSVLQLAGTSARNIDFGNFENLIYGHNAELPFNFSFSWEPDRTGWRNKRGLRPALAQVALSVRLRDNRIQSESFTYTRFDDGVKSPVEPPPRGRSWIDLTEFPQTTYFWTSKNSNSIERCQKGKVEVLSEIQHVGLCQFFIAPNQLWLSSSEREVSQIEELWKELFQKVFYLGPVRAHPERLYAWHQTSVSDTGRTGEHALEALLHQHYADPVLDSLVGNVQLLEKANYWLQKFGVVDDLRLSPIDSQGRYFELLVRTKGSKTYCPIVDVGFGTSQILPIVIQSYLAPKGSIILLEQPEMHLHPAVQADLADLLIDVAKEREIQYLVETHSEHLLRRLQQRVAETIMEPSFSKIYFCRAGENGSEIEELCVDTYGEILNWPDDFFGSVEGDLLAIAKARIERQSLE